MRVLFWGTPDFGIPALEAMRAAGHELVGVVTNPDRPAGRGRVLTPSPVKSWALEAPVPVLQPEQPRGERFLSRAAALDPEVSVVAAYGRILREEALSLPPRGSINVHASLLPELRGAAPVNWAIIRGHAESGVTIMRMVRELDAGPILARSAVEIGPAETAGELYERLAALGAETLVDVLEALDSGTVREVEQEHEAATYAPKLSREMARLSWDAPAVEIERWIRGCDPWPGAWTEWDGLALKCFRPLLEPGGPHAPPGTVIEADPKRGLLIATGDGSLRVGEVKPAGRRRMSSGAWVRGHPEVEGARLS